MRGSFLEVDSLVSSRLIAVMCKMGLAKMWRRELTAAQRIDEGASEAHLCAICLRDQRFRLLSPDGLPLGSISVPHRLMYLLLLEFRRVTIAFRVSMLPMSQSCLLCFSPFMAALGFDGDSASCWRHRAISCQFLLY